MPFDADAQWPVLRTLAESGEVGQILRLIRDQEDDADRIGLYRATIRHLAFDEWQNKDLDVMTALADAVIADCEELGGDYLEQANVICYNMSANLCDCWGDGFQRETRHYEKGIEYANKALWFREHLSKGPASFAMAMWALGKHQQSLGLLSEATESFRKCLEYETKAADEADQPVGIQADAPDGYLIAIAYVALMERNDRALSALKTVLDEMEESGGEKRGDARIIRGQLVETAKQLGYDLPGWGPSDAGFRNL